MIKDRKSILLEKRIARLEKRLHNSNKREAFDDPKKILLLHADEDVTWQELAEALLDECDRATLERVVDDLGLYDHDI